MARAVLLTGGNKTAGSHLPRVLHGALPDDGCDAAPSCLECPFPSCRYDIAGGVRELRNQVRDRGIREAHDCGESITLISASYGVSRRTVFRVVGRGE